MTEAIYVPDDPRPFHLLHKVVCCQLFICYSVIPSGLYYSWTRSSDLSWFSDCSTEYEPKCVGFSKSKLSLVILTLQEKKKRLCYSCMLWLYSSLFNLKNTCEPFAMVQQSPILCKLRENDLLSIYFQVHSTSLYHCLWN